LNSENDTKNPGNYLRIPLNRLSIPAEKSFSCLYTDKYLTEAVINSLLKTGVLFVKIPKKNSRKSDKTKRSF